MRCPACNTWMEDDAPVCWMCQEVVDPEKAAEIDTEAEQHRAEALQKYAAKRQRRSPLALVLITIGVLALFAGAFLIYYYVLADDGTATVDEYVAGERGVQYTSEEGAFTATFPTEPDESDDDPFGLGLGETAGAVESEPGRDYLFTVAWFAIDSPVSSQILNLIPGELAEALDGEVLDVAQRDLAFIPATEVAVKGEGQTSRLVFFQTDERFYAIGTDARTDDRAPFERFVGSLTVDAVDQFNDAG